MPLSHRLRSLQAELAALETELADPSNPLLQKEREEDNVDAGELIRGLVDVRGRIEKIRKGKEGRGRLVNVVLGEGEQPVVEVEDDKKSKERMEDRGEEKRGKSEVQSVVEMDRRVGKLEKLVGSTSAALDEVLSSSVFSLMEFLQACIIGISPVATIASFNYAAEHPAHATYTTSPY